MMTREPQLKIYSEKTEQLPWRRLKFPLLGAALRFLIKLCKLKALTQTQVSGP